MKKVLITGGAGFIGGHLTKKLIGYGYQVTILDSLEKKIHPKPHKTVAFYKKLNVNFIHGSLNEKKLLNKAIQDIDIVYHLAALNDVGDSRQNIDLYFENNVLGTHQLIELIEGKVRRIILTSSRAVYGEGIGFCASCNFVSGYRNTESIYEKNCFEILCPNCNAQIVNSPSQEEHICQPVSIYGTTKMLQEKILLMALKNSKTQFDIVRLFNVYGHGINNYTNLQGIVMFFFGQMNTANTFNLFEDGYQTRDFVYVTDVVDSLTRLLEQKPSNDIFNIGSGSSVSLMELTEMISNLVEKEHTIRKVKTYREGDIRHSVARVDHAKKKLNWEASINLSQGLTYLSQWLTSLNRVR